MRHVLPHAHCVFWSTPLAHQAVVSPWHAPIVSTPPHGSAPGSTQRKPTDPESQPHRLPSAHVSAKSSDPAHQTALPYIQRPSKVIVPHARLPVVGGPTTPSAQSATASSRVYSSSSLHVADPADKTPTTTGAPSAPRARSGPPESP